MPEDFLHKWAGIVQHYKNLRTRQTLIEELLVKNAGTLNIIHQELDDLIQMYLEYNKGDIIEREHSSVN